MASNSFFISDPSRLDFIKQSQKDVPFKTPSLSTQVANTNLALTRQLKGFSGAGLPLGLSTLNQILDSQGKTDPRLLNEQIAGINQGTNANVDATRGELARLGPGLQQSGVGQALLASLRDGGNRQIAGLRASEAQAAEARKRSDLGLLLDMIINPTLTQGATERGVDVALSGQRAAQQDARFGGTVEALGSFLNFFGGK